jgi:hypothetical protein
MKTHGEWMSRSKFSWPWHQLQVSGQFQAPGCITPGERAPAAHWIEGWLGLRAGLDDKEIKNSWLYRDSNSDPSVFQSVASRYTSNRTKRIMVLSIRLYKKPLSKGLHQQKLQYISSLFCRGTYLPNETQPACPRTCRVDDFHRGGSFRSQVT